MIGSDTDAFGCPGGAVSESDIFFSSKARGHFDSRRQAALPRAAVGLLHAVNRQEADGVDGRLI
jgi:hypothetical protein